VWSETLDHCDYRPPYLPQFFADAAREIPLSGREELIDLGCGTGDVALGFAPYVGAVTALDAELPMIEAVRARAHRLGVNVRLMHSRAEDAPEELGRFHLVTLGQAYWFMHSSATRSRLEKWLLPGGHVLICRPVASSVGGAPWYDEYRAIRRRWAKGDFAEKMRLTADEFFEGTRFSRIKEFFTWGQRRVALDHLVHRALGSADTSRALLGEDAELMLEEIRARMAPHFENGPLTERLCVVGLLYGRSTDRFALGVGNT